MRPERYSASARLAIVFTDTERRLVMVNRAVAKMFGFRPEEILGKKTV